MFYRSSALFLQKAGVSRSFTYNLKMQRRIRAQGRKRNASGSERESESKSSGSSRSKDRKRREVDPHQNQHKQGEKNKNSSFRSSSSKERPKRPVLAQQSEEAGHYQFKTGDIIGKKYECIRLLGTGAFGSVIEVKRKEQLFAVKMIPSEKRSTQLAKKEKKVLQALNNADLNDQHHIVRYIRSFQHQKFICLTFELLGPSLYGVIKRNHGKGFPLNIVRAFTRQIFEAVAFMHHLGYVHTDLKPENILLCSDSLQLVPHPELKNYYVPIREQIKLIDFGSTRRVDPINDQFISTRPYRSPEVILKCRNWDQSTDVWSIGCIISELVTGRYLFDTIDENVDHLMVITSILRKDFPSWMIQGRKNKSQDIFVNGKLNLEYVTDWNRISQMKKLDEIFEGNEILGDLVRKCLQLDPKERITCKQALSHLFFS